MTKGEYCVCMCVCVMCAWVRTKSIKTFGKFINEYETGKRCSVGKGNQRGKEE